MKYVEKIKLKSMILKLILIIVISVIMLGIISNIAKNSSSEQIIGNWEVKNGTIKGIDYLNYTFNGDNTFKWIIKNTNSNEIIYTGTYKMVAKKKIVVKLSNGNMISNTVELSNGNLIYDDVMLIKVKEFSAKNSEELKPVTTNTKPAASQQSAQNAQSTQTYNCALNGCPNNTNSPGSYCTVHSKGKINKCINCGAAVWADEIYCDNCLFGDFDFSQYGIDY